MIIPGHSVTVYKCRECGKIVMGHFYTHSEKQDSPNKEFYRYCSRVCIEKNTICGEMIPRDID